MALARAVALQLVIHFHQVADDLINALLKSLTRSIVQYVKICDCNWPAFIKHCYFGMVSFHKLRCSKWANFSLLRTLLSNQAITVYGYNDKFFSELFKKQLVLGIAVKTVDYNSVTALMSSNQIRHG